MPTPFHDANDGFPDFLLMNDGAGMFSDGTEQAGLAAKRNRRTFSASLLDMDGDRHLDLVVVADFSGLDYYRNRGDGTFEDVTESRVDERHGFGMSHTFGDYDGDGRVDLYMVGMSSTTARRLDALGLAREGFDEYTSMRAPMSYGNRLYVSRGDRLEQPAFAATAAFAQDGYYDEYDRGYDAGYEVIRARRIERMRAFGLIPAGVGLALLIYHFVEGRKLPLAGQGTPPAG